LRKRYNILEGRFNVMIHDKDIKSMLEVLCPKMAVASTASE
jgi:hypothetical protein